MMAKQDVGWLRATRRRSRLGIYLEVLGIIRGGTCKPTRIMYEANLSWNPMRGILESLVSQGLVREIDVGGGRDGRSSRRYEITRKGENVVGYFRRGRDLLELMEEARSGAQR